jgi:anti-sigma factor ChrR (cupin superfamily)
VGGSLLRAASPVHRDKETSMIIKTSDRSTYLDVSKIEWEPTRFPGVETKVLYRDERGRQTTLTRMAPGARLPEHRHVGIEQSYVLEGTLIDDDGACTAGNFVWRRAGSVHNAWSPDGCVVLGVFEAPNEFLD